MRTKVVAVLVLLILAVPLGTKAQIPRKRFRGWNCFPLGITFADGLPTLDGFRQGLRDLGRSREGTFFAAAGALVLVLALNLLRVDHVV